MYNSSATLQKEWTHVRKACKIELPHTIQEDSHMSYHHLNTKQRECILKRLEVGDSIRQIAVQIGVSPSTVSREIKRNGGRKRYSSSDADKRYLKKRTRCHKKLCLGDPAAYGLVKLLIEDQQWSPEQISNRLKLEGHWLSISYATIYRAIHKKMFDLKKDKRRRGFAKKLRNKGKKRKGKNNQDKRGQMNIPHAIEERPAAAGDRSEGGHLEIDTVIGKRGGACLVTVVDRMTRYLWCSIISNCTAENVTQALREILSSMPAGFAKSITPDRGVEFRRHAQITEEFNIPFYFPLPHQPWQRGTNENTNGLLREYFPKKTSMNHVTKEALQAVVNKINNRPRKCLSWLSPSEVFSQKVLHLD